MSTSHQKTTIKLNEMNEIIIEPERPIITTKDLEDIDEAEAKK